MEPIGGVFGAFGTILSFALLVLVALALLTPVFVYTIQRNVRNILLHVKSVDENIAGLRQALTAARPAEISETPEAPVPEETFDADETLFTFSAPNAKPVRAVLHPLASGCEVKIYVESALLTSRRFGTRTAAEAWANSERRRLGGGNPA